MEPAHHVCEECEAHLYCPNANQNISPCVECPFYTLAFCFLAEEDDNATDQYDRDPIFCNADCASSWLVKNMHSFIEGVGEFS